LYNVFRSQKMKISRTHFARNDYSEATMVLLNKILPALLVMAILLLACGGSYALIMTGATF
jgi:hypothetical protein